jgi:pimeloyl-ACP methyl ester carboxylesterase
MGTIARYTSQGVTDARVSVHPFTTEDGLGLSLTRFRRAPCDDVVLLVHGLTASSDMFVMPEHRNLTSFLLDSGFGDVWTLDFRMSNRFAYNAEPQQYTLDDVAHYDHPAAMAELRRHVGNRRVHVVAHCLGSVSFAMSLAANLVGDVASFVAQSAALVVRVPRWSRWKLEHAIGLLGYGPVPAVLDPRMAESRPFTAGWALARLVSLAHPECDNRACHMASFMWGTGFPSLYRHANLAPVTHDRIADLLGPSGASYYRHVRAMVREGRAVKYDRGDPRHTDLPEDYLTAAAGISTPMLFLTGDQNYIFGDANVACHRFLAQHDADRYELAVLPDYGHMDPIIGRHADRDVFPVIVDFLRRRAGVM